MFILMVNVAAVLFMTGFIWTMQLVHYPLFDRVGTDAFPSYETDHNRLFFLVAGPGIVITLVTGVLLLFVRPAQIPLAAAIAGSRLRKTILGRILMNNTLPLAGPLSVNLTIPAFEPMSAQVPLLCPDTPKLSWPGARSTRSTESTDDRAIVTCPAQPARASIRSTSTSAQDLLEPRPTAPSRTLPTLF